MALQYVHAIAPVFPHVGAHIRSNGADLAGFHCRIDLNERSPRTCLVKFSDRNTVAYARLEQARGNRAQQSLLVNGRAIPGQNIGDSIPECLLEIRGLVRTVQHDASCMSCVLGCFLLAEARVVLDDGLPVVLPRRHSA